MKKLRNLTIDPIDESIDPLADYRRLPGDPIISTKSKRQRRAERNQGRERKGAYGRRIVRSEEYGPYNLVYHATKGFRLYRNRSF